MESPTLYPSSASASAPSYHASSSEMERQDTLQPRPKRILSPTDIFRTSLPLPPLIPPLRFNLLAAGEASRTAQLFSSSHPLPRHLPFLSRLKLKTLLALTPKHPTKQVPAIEHWAQTEAVEIKWIKIEAWKDAGASAITKDVAEEATSTIISSSASPLLIVSLTPGPTALILALLRLLQGYPLQSIHPETHRCLRAGLEGEADEDDKHDCEKWITGWVGKEINLAVHRSQVHEWTWPQGTTLRWLRITDGRNSKQANGASPSAAKDGFLFPPSTAAASGTTSSLDSPFTPHRSTSSGSAHSPALLLTTPQVTHPFLKIRFLPEPVIPLALDPPALQSSAAPPPQHGAVPLVKPSGPAEGLSTPSTALKMPVGFKGRKRSLTISEGRGGGPAAAAVAAMMEAAAAAAINATSLDIDGSSGIAGHVPAGVHSGSAPPTAAPFAEAQPPPWLKGDYGQPSSASHWRWGNETSQRQHRECFPGEYEQGQPALHTPMTRTSSGDEEDEDEEENSTPKANNTRTQYLFDDSQLPASETTPSRAPDQTPFASPGRHSPEQFLLAPRRLSEASLMAEGEGESTPTKARSVSRNRASLDRRSSRGEAARPMLLPGSDEREGGVQPHRRSAELGAAKAQRDEVQEEEEEDEEEEDEDEDDYHEDSEDDFSEGLEALDLA
ncbi:hypothetical protein BCV69DRAFT_278959 [Microstroma glucosiphilum]|uniref:Uncharacterized protein n=1 Tax=Pseudomicrostroma glucosiphilum TaxID=1684307 RepID=A0A316TXZ8_9BASI|nr:hypothetical protein BCV69DRAFT_278959 [Pseudomicrostroma glucosiphilum]PWN18196.1 hypothetical protein BCV69DRAFT_278959 [Pseudomicrostroma glucosiphilum]